MKYLKDFPGFGAFGLIMVVATISLVGLVAFRFLDAQDNTEVAKKSTQPAQTTVVASINKSDDIDKAIADIDELNVDAIDNADLEAELNF